MWRIIKSEFNYYKLPITLIYLFCVICFITIWFGVKWEQNRAPIIMLIMLIGTIGICFISEKNRIIQKRDRLLLTLPITLHKIGIINLVYPFIGWLSILIVFRISSMIVQPLTEINVTRPSLIQLLTFNGLILFVNAAFLLHRDLKAVFIKQSQKTIVFLIWLISYIAIFLPFYIVINFAGAFGENTSLQRLLLELSVSPIRINALGLLISGCSFYVFFRRRSYVDS